MPTNLPPAIAAYLQAKKDYDTDALLRTLAQDVVIVDEGNEYRGSEAIRGWNDRASKEVEATYEVTDAATVGDRVVVAVLVSGKFPGSPATLYFYVALRDEKIAALTVLA